jgi:hypothetical protein
MSRGFEDIFYCAIECSHGGVYNDTEVRSETVVSSVIVVTSYDEAPNAVIDVHANVLPDQEIDAAPS